MKWRKSVPFLVAAGLLDPTLGLGPAGRQLPSCFVLPGVWSGVTDSYELDASSGLHRLSRVAAPGFHMRAIPHPSGEWLYVNAVGLGDRDVQGVFVHVFDLDGCTIGALIATVGEGGRSPSNERAYGLEVHPSGRWLFQTTTSLRELRVFELDQQSGVPSLSHVVSVDTLEGPKCIELRRLEISPDGRTLFSNCNNGSAEYALHVWRIREGGSLQLVQALRLEGINAGIFDPVLHPSGDYLYQPASKRVEDSGIGVSGAYILVYRIRDDSSLEFLGRTPVRTLAEGDPPDALVYPVTFTVLPHGEAGFVAVHASLPSMASRHEIAEISLNDGGATLDVEAQVPSAVELELSSHHGGALISSGGLEYFVSFLTDYDSIRGGMLQAYRIDSERHLVPADPSWVATGLMDARQPIPLPDGGKRN